METVNIVDTIETRLCTEALDGQKVHDLICNALNEKRTIHVSFLNVEVLTVGFLNTAIGRLYRDYPVEEIKNGVLIEDLSLSGAVTLKRVVETAKLQYRNPEKQGQISNNLLEEN
jgi:hypothetical protein